MQDSPRNEKNDSADGGGSWLKRLRALRQRPWWPWFARISALLFFALVAGLLIYQARTIEWSKVGESMRDRSATTLALAGLVAMASYGVYSSFDLFGRRVTGHGLPTLRVMATTFVSYVFNLNVGMLIGGLGFRYRLYARQGLSAETTTTVIATSMLTNWLGFLLLGGILLIWNPPTLPDDWLVSGSPLRVIGAVMVALALAWQAACMFSRRREWQFEDHSIRLPGAKMALLQFAASVTNWMLMGVIVWLLLEQQIDYPTALTTLMIAAIAGLIVRVPAGLGVIEAVFVALLGSQLPSTELIGALLLYRSIYYLAPLVVAGLLHWWLESVTEDQTDDKAEGVASPASAT